MTKMQKFNDDLNSNLIHSNIKSKYNQIIDEEENLTNSYSNSLSDSNSKENKSDKGQKGNLNKRFSVDISNHK